MRAFFAPLLFLVVLASACTGETARWPTDEGLVLSEPGVHETPIFSGTPTDLFPGTAALTRGSGQIACSGTLVRPRILLTAAHCIDVKAQTPPGGFGIFFGTDPSAGGGILVSTMAKFLHPLWNPDSNSNSKYNNDIALMALEEAPPGVEPVPLFPGPLNNGSVGDPVALVGFGVANDNEEFGIKRVAYSEIAWVGSKQVAFVGPEGTCSGDSGGPTYITDGGVAYVMSVHSTVSGCGNLSSDVRVDAHLEDFLLPTIADIEAILATEEPFEPEPNGEPEPSADDDDDSDDDGGDATPGGCSTTGAAPSLFAFALLLTRRRRRA